MRLTFYLGRRSGLLWFVGTVFVLLFLASGILIYRGVERLSQADLEQQRDFLRASLRGFRSEFAGTLLEIASGFRPSLPMRSHDEIEADLAAQFLHWKTQGGQSELVHSLDLALLRESGEVQLRRLRSSDLTFEDRAWPVSLVIFRHMMEHNRVGPVRRFNFPAGALVVLNGPEPTIAIPLPAAGGRPGSPFFPGPARSVARLAGWCFLELDLETVRREFLPELVERHFRDQRNQYKIAVLDAADLELIYGSEADMRPQDLTRADASTQLFFPRLTPAGGIYGIFAGNRPLGGLAGRPPFGDLDRVELEGDWRGHVREGWVLAVRHQLGSLEAAARHSRNRQLAVAYGILILLGSGVLLLGLNVRNAQILARRQMEFVAGISHELHTPVAVIQSAGHNLTRGLVGDPSRIQEYGRVIQNESRRLRQMVDQILLFTRLQHERDAPKLEPLNLRVVVDQVLDEYGPAFSEGEWRVERSFEEVPPVQAEVRSLESILRNLLDNALRYAAQGRWLKLSLQHERESREIRLDVADRGPGIPPSDLPHLFEPFYRGQGHIASNIPGTGLGLNLVKRQVESMGGRISVESSPAHGSTFTLCFPAAREAESAASNPAREARV